MTRDYDPYRSFRSALTRYKIVVINLVWASSQGVNSQAYLEAKRAQEKAKVLLNRQVEKLIDFAKRGEL